MSNHQRITTRTMKIKLVLCKAHIMALITKTKAVRELKMERRLVVYM